MEAHRRFAEKTGAHFPLLSDQGGQVSKLYGSNLPIIPVSARKLFVIDQQGLIQDIVDGMPNNRQLLETLDRLNAGP